MKRSSGNLERYRETIARVLARSDERCEVMIDKGGNATGNSKWWKRCAKHIPADRVTWTNFLHVATRNGKSDEWVLDPESIIFGCEQHHYEESRTGLHVTRCSYQETNYIPDPQ